MPWKVVSPNPGPGHPGPTGSRLPQRATGKRRLFAGIAGNLGIARINVLFQKRSGYEISKKGSVRKIACTGKGVVRVQMDAAVGALHKGTVAKALHDGEEPKALCRKEIATGNTARIVAAQREEM